jgi:hypothetical protein
MEVPHVSLLYLRGVVLFFRLKSAHRACGVAPSVPVLHDQAQLGNWIPRPDYRIFIGSTYPPGLPHGPSLLAVLVLLAALILFWRFAQSHKGMIPAEWWRSTTRLQTFAILIPIAFGAITLAVWLFSRLVFPVFLERYFFPNLILHVIWVSVLVDFVFTYLTPSTTRYGLTLAAAILTGLSIEYRQFDRGNRTRCFELSRRVYLESVRDYGLIAIISIGPWLEWQNRQGEVVVFPTDNDDILKKNAADKRFVFGTHFAKTFAKWMGSNTVMTTSQILNTKPGFMFLGDAKGTWLNYSQRSYKIELRRLAAMEDCKLLLVKVVD